MKSLPRSVLLALISLFSLVCAAESQTANVPRVAATTPAPAAPDHELAANDLIEIKVFQEPDLDTTARIAADGRISFPLIGEVAVTGKNAQQAARVIRDKLEARFLVNPQVTLAVLESAKRLFTVLGQVQRPGTYRFPERDSLNLIQVIGIAGGYSRIADASRVTVKRRVDGRDSVFQLDAKKMAREQSISPFDIRPGDMITVGERLF